MSPNLRDNIRRTSILLISSFKLSFNKRSMTKITAQNVKQKYFHSRHKVMHREDTATLTTYLSDNLKIFTCLTPLDDQPIVMFRIALHQHRKIFHVINRTERTISTISQTQHNNLVTTRFIAQPKTLFCNHYSISRRARQL